MKTYVSTHLVHQQDGKHLLLRRSGGPYYSGFLSLVAGHVEPGETPSAALVREAKEEIGVVFTQADLTFRLVIYRRLPDRVYVDYFFAVQKLDREPLIMEPDKASEIGYFEIADVQDQMVPYVVAALRTQLPYLEFDETGGSM